MKSFASVAAAAFAVVAAAPLATPLANAQALVTPYQSVIVQPGVTVVREAPLFAVPVAAQPVEIVPSIETVRTVHPMRRHIAVRHKIQDRLAPSYDGSLYNTAAAPMLQPAAAPPVVQVQAAVTPIVAVGQSLSGQFQCVAGCAAGVPGPAFVTQNGWDLNLVNEIGQPSRAWIDYPGHIWVQSWNEGAVYSPDQMTIQFDNGTVWSKNVILVAPPAR